VPWNRRFSLQLPDPWPMENSTSLITDSASEYQRHNLRETREREKRDASQHSEVNSEIFSINSVLFLNVKAYLCTSLQFDCVILCEKIYHSDCKWNRSFRCTPEKPWRKRRKGVTRNHISAYCESQTSYSCFEGTNKLFFQEDRLPRSISQDIKQHAATIILMNKR